MKVISITVALILAVSHWEARADATFRFSTAEPDRTLSLYLRDQRAAITDSAIGESPVLLFDQTTGVVTFVDHRYRVVTELDEASMRSHLEAAQQRMALMRQRMDAEMKKAPPQTRSMYEQGNTMMGWMGGMGNVMGNSASRQVRTEPFSRGRVADIDCQMASISEGNRKLAQLCVVRPAQLGLSREALGTLQALRTTLARLAQMGAHAMGFKAPDVPLLTAGTNDFPIQILPLDEGDLVPWALASMSKDSGDEAAWTIPQGYQAGALPKW